LKDLPGKDQVLDGKVDECLRNLEDRILRQTHAFEIFASQVVQVDTEIRVTKTNIEKVEAEYLKSAEARRLLNEKTAKKYQDQTDLYNKLASAQKYLDENATHQRVDVKGHEKTLRLKARISDLENLVDDLTLEVEKVDRSAYKQAVSQMSQILDAQATYLDTMQMESRNLERLF